MSTVQTVVPLTLVAAAMVLVAAAPGIVVGDFNASRWHPAFRRLLRSGLHDAHEQVGRRLARSWPNDSLVPAFALLDHVLLTSTVSAVTVREGTGEGSDHRPVVADLQVRWPVLPRA